uniref:Uncharacterized protein n=1 Tax=Anguilla anguilla TaxID=7936 RepID=A0A0E9UGF2_ANGAN
MNQVKMIVPFDCNKSEVVVVVRVRFADLGSSLGDT